MTSSVQYLRLSCDDHSCAAASSWGTTKNHKPDKRHGGQISDAFMQMNAVDKETRYIRTPAQLIKHGRIRLKMTRKRFLLPEVI